jgi:hypothetical protein
MWDLVCHALYAMWGCVQVMDYFGWNATRWANPAPGPPWTHTEQGVVWDTLQLPAEAPEETVRSIMVSPSSQAAHLIHDLHSNGLHHRPLGGQHCALASSTRSACRN